MSHTCTEKCLNPTHFSRATPFEMENTKIPIHVERDDAGALICLIDCGPYDSSSSARQDRYPSKVFPDGKEGMHLFSHGYTMSSTAAHFCYRADRDVVQDIMTRFHPHFVTKVGLAARYQGSRKTHFSRDGNAYFQQLMHGFKDLRSGEGFDEALEAYLNFAGALMYILPANVLYAEDARDGEGGARAAKAIGNITKACGMRRDGERRELIDENIGLIVDPKVIQAIFGSGFDDNNLFCLSYIIMHVCELRSLRIQTAHRGMLPECLVEREDVRGVVEARVFGGLAVPGFAEAYERALCLIEDEWHRKRTGGFCTC